MVQTVNNRRLFKKFNKKKYKYKTLKNERIFKVLALIFVFFFASISAYVYIIVGSYFRAQQIEANIEQTDESGDSKDLNLNDIPPDIPVDQNEIAFNVFTNSADFGIVENADIEICIYDSDLDVLVATIITNATGDAIFMTQYGFNYRYEVRLFGQSDYISGIIDANAFSIELETILLTITFYYALGVVAEGLYVELGFMPIGVTFWLGGGLLQYTTNVMGQVVISEAIMGEAWVNTPYSQLLYIINQDTAAIYEYEIVLPSECHIVHLLHLILSIFTLINLFQIIVK